MRSLLPLAIAAAVLAIPVPAQKLRAEINIGHTSEPYRLAIGYQFGKGAPLHFGFSAAITPNAKTKLPEFHVDGDFGLRLLPEGWSEAIRARLPRISLQSSPVFPGAQ